MYLVTLPSLDLRHQLVRPSTQCSAEILNTGVQVPFNQTAKWPAALSGRICNATSHNAGREMHTAEEPKKSHMPPAHISFYYCAQQPHFDFRTLAVSFEFVTNRIPMAVYRVQRTTRKEYKASRPWPPQLHRSIAWCLHGSTAVRIQETGIVGCEGSIKLLASPRSFLRNSSSASR